MDWTGARLSVAVMTLAAAQPAVGIPWAEAQESLRGQSVDKLPRPGFEPRQITVGNLVMSPELRLSVISDDNVFATSQNADDDILFRIAPSIVLERKTGNLTLGADLRADLRRYNEHPREDTNTYGGELTAGYRFNRANSATVKARYDRLFERRDDPESNRNLALAPVKIDSLQGEVGYLYRPGRLGLATNFGVAKADYLDDLSADRDLTTYRGTVRALIGLSHRLDLFVEGYGNRRDFRLATDANGVDRDSDTFGVNVGTRIDIANRWNGEIGVGWFNADPADSTLESFSGIGMNGSLTWRPLVRTEVTASFFRGDVATVRAGANGRVDTSGRFEVAQEIRHNLLLHAGVSVRETSYRQAANQTQTTFSQDIGLELLLTRHVALTFDASHAKRNATSPTDEFERLMFEVGTRLRF